MYQSIPSHDEPSSTAKRQRRDEQQWLKSKVNALYSFDIESKSSAESSFHVTRTIISTVLFTGITIGFSFGYFLASCYHCPAPYNAMQHFRDGSHHDKDSSPRSFLHDLPYETMIGIKPLSPKHKPSPHLDYLDHESSYAKLFFPDNHKHSSDYFLYESGLDAQINQAYCAVASTAAVLNSLRFVSPTAAPDAVLLSDNYFPILQSELLPTDPVYAPYVYATQEDILDLECVRTNVVLENGVLRPPFGVTLRQVEGLFNCHLGSSDYKATATIVDPDEISLDKMREDLMFALRNTTSRVLINYHRSDIGQAGGGHFSPIGSYHPPTDSFLILDVAKYKYPPVWVPATNLYNSLGTLDSCGNWNYPQAQLDLAEDDFFGNHGKLDWTDIRTKLGCEKSFRGYVIVQQGV